MRKSVDDVTIVEPPVQELTKRNRGWRRTCFTGCGFIVVFILVIVAVIRLFIGPGPQTLSAVPAQFPKDIPVYDHDTIDKITFISGRYKNRGIEIAAFFPKLILSPLFLALSHDQSAPALSPTSTMLEREAAAVRGLWKLVTTPVGDHRDTVEIEWKNIDAEPSFVISYYRKELEKSGYTVDVVSEGQGVKQFSFSKAGGGSGALFVQGDEENKPGTDYAALTVNLAK